jgi:enamine deaminase RidA (YjgF/YER057c/UK114 family)
MIEPSNPDVGYVADDVFATYGFTQTIRAGNTLYLSGVAPMRGDAAHLEVVGPTMREQLAYVMEIIGRCLAAHGASFRNWVAQTIYVTDMAALVQSIDVTLPLIGAHPPTATAVEVKALGVPGQLVEVTGIAVLDD